MKLTAVALALAFLAAGCNISPVPTPNNFPGGGEGPGAGSDSGGYTGGNDDSDVFAPPAGMDATPGDRGGGPPDAAAPMNDVSLGGADGGEAKDDVGDAAPGKDTDADWLDADAGWPDADAGWTDVEPTPDCCWEADTESDGDIDDPEVD